MARQTWGRFAGVAGWGYCRPVGPVSIRPRLSPHVDEFPQPVGSPEVGNQFARLVAPGRAGQQLIIQPQIKGQRAKLALVEVGGQQLAKPGQIGHKMLSRPHNYHIMRQSDSRVPWGKRRQRMARVTESAMCLSPVEPHHE